MAINYTEKGAGLHEYIEEQGEGLWQVDGVWYSTNDAVVQVLIDNFDALAYAQAKKIDAIKAEGANRAASIFSFMSDNPEHALDFYRLGSLIIDVIDPAARQAIPQDLLDTKAIYDAAMAAVGVVNGMTDWELVMAYDEVNTPAWP